MKEPKFTQANSAFVMTCAVEVNPVFKGVRTFKLKPGPGGSTDFWMQEHFSGIVFALVKRMLPDFRPIFEAYAGDLKREAERIAQPQVNIQQMRSAGQTFL